MQQLNVLEPSSGFERSPNPKVTASAAAAGARATAAAVADVEDKNVRCPAFDCILCSRMQLDPVPVLA
jgi:hypothetical protein